MAEILTIDNTVEQSADFTIAAGDVKSIGLTSNTPPMIPDCAVQILQKHGANYFLRAQIDERNSSAVIDAPGIWAVKRVRGIVGIDLD